MKMIEYISKIINQAINCISCIKLSILRDRLIEYGA